MKKITWEFNNGEKVTVEVEDSIGDVILESRRKEESGDHYERIHTYSIDAMVYEGKDYADPKSIESSYDDALLKQEIDEALAYLTPIQMRRLEMYLDGMSTYEIAEEEGVTHQNVSVSLIAARKNIKKFLS